MNLDIKQISFLHPTLRELLLWLEESTGQTFTITSLYREGDPGVHGTIPLRAVDLRVRSISIGQSVESLINLTWEYDPKRDWKKCAVLHGVGRNLHLHIQVHPDTKDLRF